MSEQETYNDFESLCAGYVLGALSPAEKNEFEKMFENVTDGQM